MHNISENKLDPKFYEFSVIIMRGLINDNIVENKLLPDFIEAI